jgi:uncharacterized protein YndB with AHSA1/START domain
MNDAFEPHTRDIVVDEVFPHGPETLWRVMTTGELMARWLMEPSGFEAVVGNRFTFQTKAGGEWDGVIRCEVLEVVPNDRLVFAWKGGHEANVGYGAPLETVVTLSLERVDGGTRLRLVHAGFVLPKNDSAFNGMSHGWTKVVHQLGDVAAALH